MSIQHEKVDHELRKIEVSLIELEYIGYIMINCPVGVEYTLYEGEKIVGWATFNGTTYGETIVLNTTVRINQSADYIVAKGFLI